VIARRGARKFPTPSGSVSAATICSTGPTALPATSRCAATRLVREATVRDGVEEREDRRPGLDAGQRGGRVCEDPLGQLLGLLVVACPPTQIPEDVAVVVAERLLGETFHATLIAPAAQR
jgi:hypothetical protein